jgi:phospholipase D1/2
MPRGEASQRRRILQKDVNCWRIERAGRMTVLVDGSEYFRAMKAAMENAQRSILLLGWDFDPRVRFDSEGGDPPGETFHELMQRLLDRSTTLQVHILIWDMVRAFAMQRRVGPREAGRWLSHDRLHYRLDSNIPRGAAHHQKIL